jgi:hypothetical protein
MPDHRYRLRYTFNIEPGSFTKEEVQALGENAGGTDAFVFISMLYPEDGSYSQRLVSVDGRNEGHRVSDKDLFKACLMMFSHLSESKTLDEGRRGFASDVWNAFTDMMTTQAQKRREQ